jgi:putative transposase
MWSNIGMRKAYSYRIYLTKGQQRILNQQLEASRWVYNQMLATRRDAWEQERRTLGLDDLINLLPQWKAERSDLKLVHSQVLQNIAQRVHLAFQAFFRRVRNGEQPGYPRFKGKGRYDSLTYPQYGNGVRLDGSELILSKIGRVKLVLHRPLEGTVKTVTVRRIATGKWFASFSVELPDAPQDMPPEPTVVGVDVGLEHFATLSTGEQLANPRFFRTDERALAKAQRRLSKAGYPLGEGTSERRKRRKIVAHIHERIANRRKDVAHKLSRRLVNGFQIIVFEDLRIARMITNHCLAKSIADAAWNQLASYTCYKAAEAGRTYIEVDPRGTSQCCSRCHGIAGTLWAKDLSVRVHQCPLCGLEIDRDLNAALNILALGLQRIGTQSVEAAPL